MIHHGLLATCGSVARDHNGSLFFALCTLLVKLILRRFVSLILDGYTSKHLCLLFVYQIIGMLQQLDGYSLSNVNRKII